MRTHHSYPPVTIFGAGSWGTALAIHMAQCHPHACLYLWGRDAAYLHEMEISRFNTRYLPNQKLPDNIRCSADLEVVLNSTTQDILIAVPSTRVRALLEEIKSKLTTGVRLISASKGLDLGTQQFLHEVAQEVLPFPFEFSVLAGPNFAHEVAKGLPTAVTLASHNLAFAREIQARFHTPRFRVYTSQDMIGVSLGGAMKNVLAIAVGISDGLQLGANARAALMTRGLAEMIRLGQKLGGQLETFMGLSGMGDLTLTCTDNQSRNRRFGLALGQGNSVELAERSVGQLVEGYTSCRTIYHLACKNNCAVPICETVYQILYEQLSATKAVEHLLNRVAKEES